MCILDRYCSRRMSPGGVGGLRFGKIRISQRAVLLLFRTCSKILLLSLLRKRAKVILGV